MALLPILSYSLGDDTNVMEKTIPRTKTGTRTSGWIRVRVVAIEATQDDELTVLRLAAACAWCG